MKRPTECRLCAAGLLLGLASLNPVAAGQVYKCVEGGKTRFTSDPNEAQGCEVMGIDTSQPAAEAAPRAQSQKREAKASTRSSTKQDYRITDSESQSRTLNSKIAEAVARSPLPKLPSSGGKGKDRGNSR